MMQWNIFVFVCTIFSTIKGSDSLAFLYNTSSDELYNKTNLIESYYAITCCRNGYPIPDPSIAPYIHEWTQQLAGPVPGGNVTCNRYIGQYSLPYGFTTNNKDVTVGVRCQCPEEKLDRNCRYLPDCQNSGYRSFSINLRCVCPHMYFGELCEKFCLNGELRKNSYLIDECVCSNLFYGDDCAQVTCFNGGTPVNGRGCSCPIPYVGIHCETHFNNNQDDGKPHDNLHRDLSGSMVSVFLVTAAAIIAFYLIRRHRRLRRASPVRSTLVTEVAGPTLHIGSYSNGLMVPLSTPTEFGQPPPNPPPNVPPAYDLSQFPPLPTYNDVVKAYPPTYIATESTSLASEELQPVNNTAEPNQSHTDRRNHGNTTRTDHSHPGENL